MPLMVSSQYISRREVLPYTLVDFVVVVCQTSIVIHIRGYLNLEVAKQGGYS